MTRKFINGVSISLILACGLISAHAGPRQSILYNRCEGGGITCYCTHGCTASASGCSCKER